jgi:hypothetical protein
MARAYLRTSRFRRRFASGGTRRLSAQRAWCGAVERMGGAAADERDRVHLNL